MVSARENSRSVSGNLPPKGKQPREGWGCLPITQGGRSEEESEGRGPPVCVPVEWNTAQVVTNVIGVWLVET